MFVVLLTLTISSYLLWMYVRWVKVRGYWMKLGAPYIPPNPLLGNLTFLQRYNSGIWMKEIYDRCKSPYVGIWLFWQPALVVNCPEIGRRVLIKDAAAFRNRLVSSGSHDIIGKYNIFTAKDPLWSSLRSRLSMVFTGSRLRNMYGMLQIKTKELLQRIDNDMSKSKCVNLRLVFCDYTTDVIGKASLGTSGEATLTGKSVLRSVTEEFMKFDLFRGIGWIIMFFYPQWVDIVRPNVFPKSSTDSLTEVFRTAVAQRGGYETEITEIKDLIDALIKMKQDGIKDDEDVPEEFLVAQATVFLQGGFDSNANILSWCILELAFNPEIQVTYLRVDNEPCKEIPLNFNTVLGNSLHGTLRSSKNREGTEIEVESLSNLKYLNSVIEETLRKYAPMGWIDRVASEDYKIDENLTVPAGIPVYVNVFGIHYNPEIYPEPTKFMPERFLNKDQKAMPAWSFGDGPRNCIGRRFAMIILRNALTHIILSYECRPTPSTPNPSRIEVEKRGLFYSPGEPVLIEFVHRD